MSYINFCVSVALSFGFIFGLLSFILSLFATKVYANIGFIHLSGIAAGLANVILIPLVVGLMGVVFGLISFIPFKLFLKIRKGIVLVGMWQ